MNYERHFLSACWPDITGEEYEHLKDSIYTSGLRDPITLYEGQILDGWNRYRACKDMAMPLSFVEFEGTPEEAEQFVNDKHNRRSMSLTQRMACVAKMATWPGRGRPNSAPGAHIQDKSAPSALYRKELAKKTGGSVRTAQQVINVVKSGDDAAIDAMVQGKLSAKAAEAKVKGKEEKPLPKKVVDITPAIDARKYEAMECELDAAHKQLEDLHKRIAIEALPEDERVTTAQIIESLEDENKQLRVRLQAAESQRDLYMSTCAEMERQIKYLQKRA